MESMESEVGRAATGPYHSPSLRVGIADVAIQARAQTLQ